MVSYIEVVKLAGRLSPADQLKLRNYLTSRLGEAAVATTVGEARVVVGQLLKFMQAKGLLERDSSISEIDRVLRTKVGKGSVWKCTELWSFVSGQSDDRRVREALLQLGFRLHYEELRTWIPVVSVQEMLQFLERVPACFESQFPGYASMGLLKSVVMMSKGGKIRG